MRVKHEELAEQLLTSLEVILEAGDCLFLTQAKTAGMYRNVVKPCLECPRSDHARVRVSRCFQLITACSKEKSLLLFRKTKAQQPL